MTPRRIALVGLLALVAGLSQPGRVPPPTPGRAVDTGEAISRLRAAPLAFEENRGQTAAAASFVARGQGYAMWATAEGPVLRLGDRKGDKAATLRLRAVGATLDTAVAEAPLGGRANYFIGNDASRWITDVPRFGALRYRDVYDGIDLVLHGTQQSLEYDFEVRPHADPAAIAVAFDGVDGVRIEADGDLSLDAAGAGLRFHRPVAYQQGDSGRELVDARYELTADGEVRFVLGEYDRSRPLVIDPVVDYSTYLGGGTSLAPTRDEAFAVAVDAQGNAYLAGFTNAINFPVAGAQFDPTCGGCFGSGGDAFVAKIDPSQSGAASLIYTTYLGSPGNISSVANAIAVDAAGAVHVTGWTGGYDVPTTPINDSFPVTPSGFQQADGGDLATPDGFFAKLDANGSTLLYSTYLGGNNTDEGYGVRVDAAGFTYVAGRTAANNWVAVKNGFAMTNASPGLFDAFVVKIDTSAAGPASLLYGTLYGGTGSDNIESLAIDAMGRAYVTGDSNSNGNTLPIVNGFLPTTTPGQHAFVAVFDPALSGAASLYYSTYIGTSGTQGASFREGGVAVDANGIIYVTGTTFGGTFATTPGAYKSVLEGSDAYVLKIDPSQPGAASLLASTLFGGSFNDNPYAITIDNGGNPVLTGSMQSPNFPITACGMPKGNGVDAFVTVLNTDLTGLLYSTAIAASGSEFGYGVAVGPTGALYVAGATDSTNFPVTANAYDTTHQTQCNGCGTWDAFLIKISTPIDRCPSPPIAAGSNQSTPEDTPKAIVLSATDLDGHLAPPDTLTWTITQAPTKGTLDISSGTMTHGFGSAYTANVVYTPNLNVSGADSFKFQVNDGALDSNVATVTVNVQAVNDAPIANPQTLTTLEGTPKPLTLTASDAENNVPLTFAIAAMPSNGLLNGAGNAWTYTPNAGFAGTDQFTFTAKDSLNAVSAPAVVTIEVTPINQPPVANDDAASTAEDQPITIAVLANDTDGNGDALFVVTATCDLTDPTVNADGTLFVHPPHDYSGPIACSYTNSDNNGGTDTAAVTITVTPVNDAPDAAPDSATTTEDLPVVVAVLANDLDVDGDTLTVTSATCDIGTAVVQFDNTVRVGPPANYHGPIACDYAVADNAGGTDQAALTISVTPEADAPVANDDTASTPEDQPITIAVLANDTDGDGDVLSIAAATCDLTDPTVNADGTLFVHPPHDYTGPIACSYTASDNTGGTDTASVVITVTPVNDAPEASNDSATTAEDLPVAVSVLANDLDIDGDTLTVTSASCNLGSVLVLNGQVVRVGPPQDFHGPITCNYTVSDNAGGSDTAALAITVTPANDAPIVIDPDDKVTQAGTAVTVQVVASDIDLDALIFGAAGLPDGLTMSANGLISGAPTAAAVGTHQVTVTADDGNGGADSATFVWLVTPGVVLNQPPVCVAAAPSVPQLWPANKQMIAVNVLGVIDPDGPAPAIVITAVQQDEPTAGPGNPNNWIDGAGVNTPTAMVRKERDNGPADGRIYEIFFTATDAAGATCTGAVLVGVPKDPDLGPAIDSGVRYDSTIAGGPPIS